MTDGVPHPDSPSRRKRFLFALFTLFVAAVVGLVLMECVVRALTPMRASSGELFDELPDDPIRYRLHPGADAIYIGARATVNSAGYRGDALPSATREHTLRLAVLGDSMTFGNGVEDAEPYPQRLAHWLTQHAQGWTCRAANLGVPSYNTEQVATQLERIGLGLRPDLVLYGFFVNDGAPMGTSIHWARPTPGLLQWAADMHTIRLLQMKAPQLITSIRESLGVRARSEGYIEYYREGTETRKVFHESLLRMKTLCEQNQIPLAVALIPFWVPFDDYPWADVHAVVREELELLNIPHIDLALAWKEKQINGRDYWIDIHESHPNPAGHQLIADTLGPFLEETVWPTTIWEARYPFPQ